MFLAAYGKKCNIPFEKVNKDVLELVPRMDALTGRTERYFTERDALDALKAYRKSAETYSIKIISDRTGLQILRNKHNSRSTVSHLERARIVQEIDYPNGEWRNKEGAPKKGSCTRVAKKQP